MNALRISNYNYGAELFKPSMTQKVLGMCQTPD